MNEDIFDTVYCFGVKKVECIVRSRKVTVHAVCYESLGIVDMGGCFPGVVCISNFVAGCAKLRCRGSDHGVITKTEKGKRNEYAEAHKGGGNNKFFHFTPACLETRIGEWIKSIVNHAYTYREMCNKW
jgi:hypothetical protein